MPFEHSIDSPRRRVRVEAREPIDLTEALVAADRLAADPAFEPGFRILVDLRQAALAPTAQEIEAFARSFSRMKEVFCERIALVTAGALSFGLARMTCLHAEALGFQMRPFDALEPAEAWLDEDAPPDP